MQSSSRVHRLLANLSAHRPPARARRLPRVFTTRRILLHRCFRFFGFSFFSCCLFAFSSCESHSFVFFFFSSFLSYFFRLLALSLETAPSLPRIFTMRRSRLRRSREFGRHFPPISLENLTFSLPSLTTPTLTGSLSMRNRTSREITILLICQFSNLLIFSLYQP